MVTIKVQVWDWPLRLFHWLLVLAVVACYVTGELGGSLTDWHGRFGSLVLGLLVFRLIWGFIGPTHARFSDFFPTIDKLSAYFKGEWQGAGHNPLGSLSVFALLGILLFLVMTGLFANDDIAFEGPWFQLVDKELSDKLSGWHDWAVDLLIALVALHIAAILFYLFFKKTNLVTAMLTGHQFLPESIASRPIGKVNLLKFIISLLISCSVAWGVWKIGIG